jgi:hypothetical protein
MAEKGEEGSARWIEAHVSRPRELFGGAFNVTALGAVLGLLLGKQRERIDLVKNLSVS